MNVIWKTSALYMYMISFVSAVSESSSNDLVDINVFFSVFLYQIFFKNKQCKISYTNNCQDHCNDDQWNTYHVPFSIIRFPHRTLCGGLSINCKKKKKSSTIDRWNWLSEILSQMHNTVGIICKRLFQFITLRKNYGRGENW